VTEGVPCVAVDADDLAAVVDPLGLGARRAGHVHLHEPVPVPVEQEAAFPPGGIEIAAGDLAAGGPVSLELA
jgi:hypothetical protein